MEKSGTPELTGESRVWLRARNSLTDPDRRYFVSALRADLSLETGGQRPASATAPRAGGDSAPPVAVPGIAIAPWAEHIRLSPLQDMLTKFRPALSFALGLPSPELFPVEDIGRAAAAVLADDELALQYGPAPIELREHVVEIMRWRGVSCKASEVFITSGAQQGLSLLAKLLTGPGGSVACEKFAYTGFLQAIEPMSPKLYAIDTDLFAGISVDALEALIAGGVRPSFLYINPTGHNPLGLTLAPETHGRLADLSRKCLTIVEDDAYGFLQYDNVSPALKASEPNRVIYVGSFSKILSPALRAGWIIVPENLHLALANIKEGSDINTVTFSQRVVCRYLEAGTLREHIRMLVAAYRRRRDIMLEALARILPPGSRWTKCSAGVFVWVELPEPYDTTRLLERALAEYGIAFVPGTAFSVASGHDRARRCLRLNFSHCREHQIGEGLASIGRILSDWKV